MESSKGGKPEGCKPAFLDFRDQVRPTPDQTHQVPMVPDRPHCGHDEPSGDPLVFISLVFGSQHFWMFSIFSIYSILSIFSIHSIFLILSILGNAGNAGLPPSGLPPLSLIRGAPPRPTLCSVDQFWKSVPQIWAWAGPVFRSAEHF